MLGKFFNRSTGDKLPTWSMTVSDEGVRLVATGEGSRLTSPLLQGYIAQLIDDGFATDSPDGISLQWGNVYAALESPGYPDLLRLLGLPEFTKLVPCLRSSGSLTDEHFVIAVSGWAAPSERARTVQLTGALIGEGKNQTLMRPEHWALVREVVRFAQRDVAENFDAAQRAAWGRIRSLAIRAGAHLDDFLDRTVVLTPERLDFDLRKSETVAGTVIEVFPRFEGAPTDWLERFDARRDVPERYDIPTARGIVQILVTPKVRTVLQEIKRLPGRRIAGSRAEAFLLNPYAALGPDAKDIIDEQRFEEAKSEAGIFFERFTPTIEHDGTGYPIAVGLIIESAGSEGPVSSQTKWLNDEELCEFVGELEAAIAGDHPLLGWNGYDLEIQGDAATHLAELKAALERRKSPPPVISWEQVYDLRKV